MPVSGMLQLADAIEQQQLQRCSVNGTSSQPQQLRWQQQGLQLPPQQSNGSSSSSPCCCQQSATVLQHQQHWRHDGRQSYAEAAISQSAAASAAAAAADGVLELDVRGSPLALSEQLEQALQRHAAVCMPVVYDKQTAKLLEATALLNRRWQQLQQQQQHLHGGSSSSSTAGSGADCCGATGLQLVLQLQEGWVQRQSGPRPGLHVYVFAVPSVY
jgi:hypothetical protein